MKTINIYPQDIIPNAKYMHDAEGRMDLLGQIFYTGYGIRVPVKTRTPQDLDSPIHPFTRVYRRYCVTLTPMCQALLDLSPLPGKKQVAEANPILLPYNIKLVIAGEVEAEKILAAKPSNLPKLDLTDLLRTSQYQCTCSQSFALSEIVIADDENDTHSLYCPYCWAVIPEVKEKLIESKFPSFKELRFLEQERKSCITNTRSVDTIIDGKV